MKKLLDFIMKIRRVSPSRLKAYTTAGVLASLVLLPDLYLEGVHHLLELVHLLYETLCFLLEELIGHSLHISKYHSQLILFYMQLAIAAGLAYKAWKTTPDLYRRAKAGTRAYCRQSITAGKQLWREMPGRKRVKVIAGCAAGMFGLYFWATS